MPLPENLSEELANQTNMNQSESVGDAAASIADLVGTQAVGGAEMTGLFVLIGMGWVIWKGDGSTDLAAAVLVPASLFLANFGFLPAAAGLVDGLLISVAAVFAFGLARIAFR